MRTVTRFAVPGALAAALAAGAVLGPQLASADPDLPPTTAAELLADIAAAQPQPFSGTAVATADLGLPELPTSGGQDAELTSLLAGSTTVRLWYAGPERARAAVLGTLAETDVVRNGQDLWLWRSDDNSAVHVTVPDKADLGHDGTGYPDGTTDGSTDGSTDGGSGTEAPPLPGATSPADAAESALAAIEPSTAVSLDGTAEVADRDAYELVLEPRDPESLIGEVRLTVDAVTSMPLRVQVTARGADEPAYENGFESITFGEPAAEVFAFSPPPGAEVTEVDAGDLARGHTGEHALPQDARPAPDAGAPSVVGEDWTSVLVLRGVDPAEVADATDGQGEGIAGTLLAAFQPVSGEYGTGRVFSSSLLSVLMLDDGRTLVGAVPPAVLERAALDPAAALDAGATADATPAP